MKRWTIALSLALTVTLTGYWLVVSNVYAGAIHSWNTGDALNAVDLNSNFSHIHSLMVGGHGARLVDGDVTIGALTRAKMQYPANAPVAWWMASANCSSSPCTALASSRVSSVTRNSIGNYTVTLSDARPDVTYYTIAAASGGSGTFNGNVNCYAGSYATTTFIVTCWQLQVPSSTVQGTPIQSAAVDGAFGFVVFDDE